MSPSLIPVLLWLYMFLGIGGTKLLGVPAIPHKSNKSAGDLTAGATIDLLNDWDATNSIVGMVFDTTSSNTGHKTATCITLQTLIDRPLLWLACRHHIGEVVLRHIWDDLKIEVSKSPAVSIFMRFKNNFEMLDSNDLQRVQRKNIMSNSESQSVIDLLKDTIRDKNSEVFLRGDYKELVEISLFYLDPNSFKEYFGRDFSFKRPGAMHKARWMAKLLYSLKMVLMRDMIAKDLPKGAVFRCGQLNKLNRFVKFVLSVYIPWWIKSPLVAAAPINDTKLLQDISSFTEKDKLVGNSALKSLKNHLWYLTEELVPLSLFSNEISQKEKTKMVEAIISFKTFPKPQNRHGTGYGKPTFPKILNINNINLQQFIGPDSHQLFSILRINESILSVPVDQWDKLDDYIEAKKIVNSLKAVNDAAERGVKLGSDFLGTAKIEERYQNILQAVENDRKYLPNQRKKRKVQEKRGSFNCMINPDYKIPI